MSIRLVCSAVTCCPPLAVWTHPLASGNLRAPCAPPRGPSWPAARLLESTCALRRFLSSSLWPAFHAGVSRAVGDRHPRAAKLISSPPVEEKDGAGLSVFQFEASTWTSTCGWRRRASADVDRPDPDRFSPGGFAYCRSLGIRTHPLQRHDQIRRRALIARSLRPTVAPALRPHISWTSTRRGAAGAWCGGVVPGWPGSRSSEAELRGPASGRPAPLPDAGHTACTMPSIA